MPILMKVCLKFNSNSFMFVFYNGEINPFIRTFYVNFCRRKILKAIEINFFHFLKFINLCKNCLKESFFLLYKNLIDPSFIIIFLITIAVEKTIFGLVIIIMIFVKKIWNINISYIKVQRSIVNSQMFSSFPFQRFRFYNST